MATSRPIRSAAAARRCGIPNVAPEYTFEATRRAVDGPSTEAAFLTASRLSSARRPEPDSTEV